MVAGALCYRRKEDFVMTNEGEKLGGIVYLGVKKGGVSLGVKIFL